MQCFSKAVQNLPVSGLLDSDLSSNELFHELSNLSTHNVPFLPHRSIESLDQYWGEGCVLCLLSLRLSIDVGLCVKVSTSNQVLSSKPMVKCKSTVPVSFLTHHHQATNVTTLQRFSEELHKHSVPNSKQLQTANKKTKKNKFVETNSKSKNIVLIFYLNFTQFHFLICFTLHGLLASRNIRSFHRGRR